MLNRVVWIHNKLDLLLLILLNHFFILFLILNMVHLIVICGIDLH